MGTDRSARGVPPGSRLRNPNPPKGTLQAGRAGGPRYRWERNYEHYLRRALGAEEHDLDEA